MTAFGDFYNADIGVFHDAARGLSKAAENVRDRALDYRNRVAEHLADTSELGIWGGPAAEAAQQPMQDLQVALNTAADQLEEVPGLLETYASEAGELQTRLRDIVETARERGLEVNERNGSVRVPPEVAERLAEAGESDPAGAVAADISRVFNDVNELDRRIAPQISDALAMALNAREVGGEHRADAHRAAELIEQLGEGSLAGTEQERAELAALLKEHGDDPVFAGRLFNELGGHGAVEALAITAGLGASAAVMGGERGAELSEQTGALQARFGKALAAATDPDSPYAVDVSAGSEWMREFTAAGESKMDIGRPGYEPYGYQLIGTALRSGEYSSEFLTTLGAEMVQFEQDPDSEDFRMNVPEGPMHEGFRLNHIDDSGAGFDPIDGLMIAMESNGEAGREFFSTENEKGEIVADEARIEYLLDRGDWADVPTLHQPGGDYQDPSQSYTLDALATATDGQQPTDAGPGFAIADETIRHVTGAYTDAELNENRIDPEVVGLRNDASRESMGRLLEGQMEQVNHGYYGGDWSEGPSKLALDTALVDVAHSPEAYASLSNAQNAYSALQMNEYMGDGSGTMEDKLADVERVGQMNGKVMGFLDEGRSEAISSEWKEQEDYDNARVEAGGETSGYALGKAVESVPGGELVTSTVIDEIVEGAKVDYEDRAMADNAALTHRTEGQLQAMAEHAIWEHQLVEPEVEPPAQLHDEEGKRIPIADMNEDRLDAYTAWKMGDDNTDYNDAVEGAKSTAEGAYDMGRGSAARKSDGY